MSNSNTTIINLTDITFTYPSGAAIFQSFNWRVERGETWAIIGPSGCGKSTLLYLTAGLRKSTSGQVLVDNQSITRPRPKTGLI